jgi:DNA topoisomerase I
MAERYLVVVESPAKAKTINKYLGKQYIVKASYGHVRDLIPRKGSVEVDNHFKMHYAPIDRNKKHFNELTKALKDSDGVILATDPDREGEAIAWHVLSLLQEKKAIKDKSVCRVVFNQITKKAVKHAIENPREIALDLVDAYKARRALDYLVGFTLSPLLWKKIQRGLSAGRVQSPALRLIAEREQEIEAFVKKEYWTIHAKLNKEKKGFPAKLTHYNGDKLSQFTINNETLATEARDTINKAANGELEVMKVTKKERKRKPTAPFITSTLQQEAARKLGFTAKRTMMVAQQLYEGIDIGEDGTVGLITYMRTDSTQLAEEAIDEIRAVIEKRYGADNCPKDVRVYKTKSKNAQEAHEGIRPTSVQRLPDNVKSFLNKEQFNLYGLIWKRAVASQMIDATLHTVAVDLGVDNHLFRANGSTVVTPGFMTVYQEDQDDKPKESDEKLLPAMEEGETIKTEEIHADQHFTEPPPRFNEASLVKKLEEFGIGRPSTYAAIISTLQQREYVEMDNKRFIPTDIGRIVNQFLTDHFTQYVDYNFTASLEDLLDDVAAGNKNWEKVLDEYWQPFNKLITEKGDTLTRDDVSQTRELGIDAATQKPILVKIGRYGPYVQLGTVDDEKKPKFVGLLPHQSMQTITLEEAEQLLSLPRKLGLMDGKIPISINIGRYGPYVKYGHEFASLGKDDDMFTVTLDRAIEIVKLREEMEKKKVILEFPEHQIQVLNGRYGPYITNGEKNAKIPKDQEPAELTEEQCIELLKNSKKSRFARRKKTES